ncbi:cytochrome c peroxidase [Anatilimnocola aggregata]|nr:cytochrome c peroxidase [Anatilimnocola aggregata]
MLAVLLTLLASCPLFAQDKSVNPGINKAFDAPNVPEFVERFEIEGRDVFDHRKEVVAALGIKEGMAVADVGAGTGLFTRMFSPLVGAKGKVYAVDISDEFVSYVEKIARQQKLENIVGVVCKPDSVELPPNSVDLVFICDTYHHFEFPHKTMRSIHKALKPNGQVVLVDFHRIPGKSSEWAIGHVRAGQEVFTKEIVDAGFKQIEEKKDMLKESYFVRFEKQDGKAKDDEPLVPLPKAAPAPLDNPTTPEKVSLGKQLFFDHRLSGDNTISCATCHLFDKAFGDGVALGQGVGGKKLSRNTQTCLNCGFFDNFFWDGRAATLEEQALGPILSPDEMNQGLNQLEEELNAIPAYVRQFKSIFGTKPHRDGIAKALAAYQRTLVTEPSPYDRYLKGDKQALSSDAIRGLELFQGEAGCTQCHHGPLLSDSKFYRLGTSYRDEGRGKITGKKEDRYRFRTPTLRNVSETAPYMHDGTLKTLNDVVEFYYRGIPKTGPDGLLPDTAALSGQSFSEIPLLVAFLNSLTGKSPIETPPVLPALLKGEPETSISPAVSDSNGFLIHRIESPYQAEQTSVRVLLPDRLEQGRKLRVVYVLPVEAGNGNHYGDGLLEVKKHDLHNKLQTIFVAPTFSRVPWYADHPTDLKIRQETYFINVVLPLIEQTYPAQKSVDGRLLIGFSKSGWGAWSLLLRHPNLFGRAAAWDAPMMMADLGKYATKVIFGNQEAFEPYRISDLVAKKASAMGEGKRLLLTGYGSFRQDHQRVHALLDELKIPHEYRDGPQRKHDWHSGWVTELVELLVSTNGGKN